MAICQQILTPLETIISGSYSNTNSGTVNFPVPAKYNTLTVQVWGGGGGGANAGTSGSSGGTTSFGSYISATGGAGGAAGSSGVGGAGGSGVSGSYNQTGETGASGGSSSSSYGGAAANTSSGGGARKTTTASGATISGQIGNPYGGGGSGYIVYNGLAKYTNYAGGGGAGYAVKTFVRNEIPFNTTVSVTVGAGATAIGNAGGGANGAIFISWS